jgi:imidazolonepropionase-like amidohydrolase
MRRFRELGGQLVTGADMQFGGIMLHRELRNLAEVGLSANEIITAATGGAAKALGLADRLGTIQPGMLADLVVINADPLQNLRALRDIAYVVKGGAIVRSVGSPATVSGPATVDADHRA